MSVRNLESLFRPRSIALVGATDRAASVGAVTWRNLRAGGFDGPIWPVNRRLQSLDGQTVYPDVDSLPEAPELAVICTPPETVPGLIEQLGRKGTRAAVVITAGLQQASGRDGASLQQAALDAARPFLLRILGPNCLGLVAPAAGVNASFAPGQARPGHLAFLTQSGALATAMLDWANERQIGFSSFVSLGDSADVDFGDLLDYLGSDADTHAILMYAESVKHPRKFMSAARAAARNKPVIVVKSGRAPGGAQAARSHTGALAGSDTVFDAAVRRAGMLRVNTLEELFDAAESLSHPWSWRGDRLAILTNGGGAGVLAADALQLQGGQLAPLSSQTLDALGQVLPAGWSHGNPVDIIGDAPVQRYLDALRILAAAPEVDAILFMHAPTAIVPAPDIAAAVLPLLKASGKPVLTSWIGGTAVARARQMCREQDVASHDTPESAVAAWMQLATYRRNQEALLELPATRVDAAPPDTRAARELLAQALQDGREWLGDVGSVQLLTAYGVPCVQTVAVHTAEEAAITAAHLGFPVALKVDSPQIQHKSDVGGVAVNLRNAEEVRNAALRMRQRVAHDAPQAHVTGFVVQKMADVAHAREVILGISNDPVFGPVLLFGEGGTEVELRKDRAVELPPLNAKLAAAMIDRTLVGKLLHGWRGKPAVDVDAVIDSLLKVSRIACDLAEVAELDINPLLVNAQGVVALDARVRLRRPAAGEGSRLALRPYPSELEATITVGGQSLQLRPIRPDDGARLHAFYENASPEDMRLRFFLARREIPRTELSRYCQIDYEREMTFVALEGDAIAGEVRAICDPDNIQAEFAIQIAGAWQHRGLGLVLLQRMVEYLQQRGTHEMVGQCLRENTGMAALAVEAGLEVKDLGDGYLTLRKGLRATGGEL